MKLVRNSLLFIGIFEGMEILKTLSKYRLWKIIVWTLFIASLFLVENGVIRLIWHSSIFVFFVGFELFEITKTKKLEQRAYLKMYETNKFRINLEQWWYLIFSLTILGLFVYFDLFQGLNQLDASIFGFRVPVGLTYVTILYMPSLIKFFLFDEFFILEEGLFDTRRHRLFKWELYDASEIIESEESLELRLNRGDSNVHHLKLNDKTLCEAGQAELKELLNKNEVLTEKHYA